jgi:hypothetical protein
MTVHLLSSKVPPPRYARERAACGLSRRRNDGAPAQLQGASPSLRERESCVWVEPQTESIRVTGDAPLLRLRLRGARRTQRARGEGAVGWGGLPCKERFTHSAHAPSRRAVERAAGAERGRELLRHVHAAHQGATHSHPHEQLRRRGTVWRAALPTDHECSRIPGS